MKLTQDNYFSSEAMKEYWSVSQFKQFQKCPASAIAEMNGDYEREKSTALLVGSYVDAYFTGDKGALGRFVLEHPEITNSRTGALKADFKHAETMVEAVKRQSVMMDYLSGDKQTIGWAELFGVKWKTKMDVYDGHRIVDLKTVKDFKPIYEEGFGWRSWIEYWGYDIQGAIYQRVEQAMSGRLNPLPFYIVAVTKEKVPDVAVIHLPQHVLDTALKVVEAKIDKFDLMKKGLIPAERCEVCDWCKQSKVLGEPMEFEIYEA